MSIQLGLALLSFAVAQDNAPDCGKLGQKCCTLSDYEVEDRKIIGIGKIELQSKTDKFRYCAQEFYEDLQCDPVTDTCVDEDTLDCGREGERCCNLKYDVAGDFPSMLVCLDEKHTYGYSVLDLYCDFADNTCKQYEDLSCGTPGQKCCAQDTVDSSEVNVWPKRYTVYNYNCRDSWCTDGVCETCNKDGDKCCEINRNDFLTEYLYPSTEPFCMDMLCVDGTCKACGEEGQLCCDDERKSTLSSDYFDWFIAQKCNEDKLVCSNGRCVADVGSCQGVTCELNEECYDGVGCILCGQQNDVCCPDKSCKEDFLTCLGGKCKCGEPGQKCCAGVSCWLCNDDYCYQSEETYERLECIDGLCVDLEQETSCGQKGEQCCDGGVCVDSAVCNKKKNKCRACGKKNEKCCKGGSCANARVTCNSDGRCVKD